MSQDRRRGADAPAASLPPPRLLSLGDGAISVEFAATASPQANARVQALGAVLAEAAAAGDLPGVVEWAPTLRSLLVVYDPCVTRRAALAPRLLALADHPAPGDAAPGRQLRLPVCFDPAFAPDLPELAARLSLSPAALVERVLGSALRVWMLGFLPGFAYLGGLDPDLAVPRRADPRPRVPKGSLAIAGGLAALYPSDSPGGWHLIGRTPLSLFDPNRAPPVAFAPGDRVSLRPIDPDTFARLAAAPDLWPRPEPAEA